MAATKRILALQDGPCILVAHSYGGAVITEAGTDPSVRLMDALHGVAAGLLAAPAFLAADAARDVSRR